MIYTFDTELRYFHEHEQEYLKYYRGMYVLIKGEEFAGAYTTEIQAYAAGLERFGNVPFLIRRVENENKSVIYGRGF